jgi:hypothetical protein
MVTISSRQWAWVAILAWSVVMGLVVARVLIEHGQNHSVYGVYAGAGQHWLHAAHLYNWQDAAGYRYSPVVAGMFAPLSLLPDRLGGLLWRLLNASVYLSGLAWCCRIELPTRLARQYWPALFLLVIPLSMGSINSGQANCLVIGLLLCAIAATDRGRWNLAAACVALACLLKLYPIAVGLLLIVMFPRKFAPRFVLALAIGLALPFILNRPSYAWGEYADWPRRLGAEDRTGRPLRSQFQDIRLLLLAWRMPLSGAAYLAIQLLVAALIGLICVAARHGPQTPTSRWRQRLLLGRMLALACCWMTVLGPSTESSTYILIAPALAWALLEERFRARLFSRLIVLTSCGLFLVTNIVMWFPVGRDFAALGTQVIAALLLLGHLLVSSAYDLRASPALISRRSQGSESDARFQRDERSREPIALSISSANSSMPDPPQAS